MAAHSRPLEPHRSAQHFFGAELRHRRTEAGLSLAALAGKVFVTADLLGKIEAALRFPSADLARRSDIVLGSDGALTRLHAFAVAERHRRRRLGAVDGAGISVGEVAQLLRLLAVINRVAAAQTYSGPDLIDLIGGALSDADTSTRGGVQARRTH